MSEHSLFEIRQYNLLKNYFDDEKEIEFLLERYNNGERKDFILENLQTHDWRLLKKSLEKEFNNLVTVNLVNNKASSDKEFIIVDVQGSKELPASKILNSFKNNKAKDIINFYGYTLSGIKLTYVYLEPEFPNRAEDFLYKNCNGVCFHLCEKSMFKESILKTGLRCKNRDNDKTSKYRNWPKRIYVYATESYKDKEKLKSELEDLAYEISDGYLRLEDYVVLRIQFPSTGLLRQFNFYKDSVMKLNGSMFTYQNIPGNFISIMKI